MDPSGIPFDPYDLSQLNKFRLIVAGAFRDLLAAWKKEAPDSFPARYESIWNKGLKSSNATALTFLVNAARNLKRIPREFGGYQDSVPSSEPGEELGMEGAFMQIRETVLTCADPDELQTAIRNLQGKRPVEWESLVDWSVIPRLRRLLDELPNATKHIPAARAERIWELTTDSQVSLIFQDTKTGKNKEAERRETSLTPQSWNLLRLLLGQNNHTATVPDLALTVWGDREKRIEGNPLNSELRRIRAAFRELKAPFTIKVLNHVVVLSRSPPKSAQKKKRSRPIPKRGRPDAKGRRGQKK